MQKQDQGIARTFEKKVATLRKTFFPLPIEADLSNIIPEREEETQPIQIDPITDTEVYRTIFRLKQDKAPGIDGLPHRFLRIIIKPFILRLQYLFDSCLRISYHPKEFKKANTIIFKKPRKTDYT